MANHKTSEVIQHLCRAVQLQDRAGMTDGQLLECFLARRDAAAFAALVRRHAPMVWGVCRRVLNNHHDAEDAFQATFLVLVRKASSVEPREMVANWLYGVANQTALKARSVAAKRKGRERQVVEMPEPAIEEQDVWLDLQPLLDQELSRLPDKYRGPIVLCDLEGKTRKEAAHQLGWPEGTVAGRLAIARKMLARRLAQRGVGLSGAALAAVLSARSASASALPALVGSTIKAASLLAAGRAAGVISVKVAALAEGVLKAMFVTKIKSGLAVVLVVGLALGGIGVGVGLSTGPMAVAQRPGVKSDDAKQTDAEEERPLPDDNELGKEKNELRDRAVTGRVVQLDRTGAIAYLNLGSSDGITPKVTFSIRSMSLDHKLNPAKGTLEVVRVIGPHLAQARVTKVLDPKTDPICQGDEVFNPTWNPGKTVERAVPGTQTPPKEDSIGQDLGVSFAPKAAPTPDQQVRELLEAYNALPATAKVGIDGDRIIERLNMVRGKLSPRSQETVARLRAAHTLRSLVQALQKSDQQSLKNLVSKPSERAILAERLTEVLPYIEPSPRRWEYKILSESYVEKLGEGEVAAGLGQLGEEGWELVGFVKSRFVFKRQK
jgi:RNA polymerase sigma factor (sigma-70 family)